MGWNCSRYEEMMIDKYPILKDEIKDNMMFIREKKVLPINEMLQFVGPIAKIIVEFIIVLF